MSTIYLGFVPDQSDFEWIFGGYFIAFCSYLLLVNRASDSIFNGLIVAAILIRIALVFSFPNLSDDIFRFVWDGRLIHAGVNPYSHLPTDIVSIYDGYSWPHLLDRLNSPNYYSVYPPVAQLFFAIATWFTGDSVYAASIIIKCLMVMAEIGSFYFVLKILNHFKLDRRRLLWYALNPLIILELVGNLHFEGFMIFFLLAFYWLFVQKKYLLSTAMLALSIGTKLLPLMFLPYLMYQLGFWKALRYYLVLSMMLLVIFLPMGVGVEWAHFANSLDLYFRKFEFNASLYYIGRAIGYTFRGYNEIAYVGPILALGSLTSMLILWITGFIKKVKLSLAIYFLWSFTIYLLFTTTVHPWYLSIPIVMSCMTRFRFPIVWSGLITLSYINYSYDPYWENLWIVGLEYGLVFSYLCYELFIQKRVS